MSKGTILDRKGIEVVRMRVAIVKIALDAGGEYRKIQQKFGIQLPSQSEVVMMHDELIQDEDYRSIYEALDEHSRQERERFYSSEWTFDYLPTASNRIGR